MVYFKANGNTISWQSNDISDCQWDTTGLRDGNASKNSNVPGKGRGRYQDPNQHQNSEERIQKVIFFEKVKWESIETGKFRDRDQMFLRPIPGLFWYQTFSETDSRTFSVPNFSDTEKITNTRDRDVTLEKYFKKLCACNEKY